jgi:hypothetical protein
MEKTLQVLNELESKGLIVKYAIGGAIAATFYMEPVLTYGLDVFVSLSVSADSLVLFSPIYEYLRGKGYATEHEHVLIEGVPVQFLPAYNALVEEALEHARETSYGKTQTRVLRAEHLLAIMLQIYRPKDKTRLTQMLEEAEIDGAYLTGILERHGLDQRWCEFKRQFGVG